MKSLIIFRILFILMQVMLFFASIAQPSKRENDSIFEVKGKKLALGMNSNPSAMIDEAIAFVIFCDTSEFEYRNNAPFQSRQVLAALYARTGQFDKAIQLHKDCLNIAVKQQNEQYIGVTYYNIAVAYYREGYQLIGQQYLDSAMVLYQKSVNMNGLLKSYSLHLAIFTDRNDFTSVLEYSDIALKTIDTIKPRNQMHLGFINELKAGYYISRGKAFLHFKDQKEASKNFIRALECAEESELSQMSLTTYINLAKIYIQQEKWKNFDILIRKAIKIAKETKSNVSLYELITLQAEKEAKNGKYDEAIQLLDSIEPLVIELSDIDFRVIFNETKAEVLKQKEDFRASLIYSEIADSLNSIRLSEENEKLSEELSQRYKLSEKEMTINILNKNKILQEQLLVEKEKSRKTYQWLSYILTFIVLLIIFLIFRIYQKNNKLNQLNRFQKKVFTVLSHDIRNYSSAIQISPELTIQLLDKDELAKAKNILIDMQEKLQMLHQSLSNILFWAAPQIKDDKMQAISLVKITHELELQTSIYQVIARNYAIEINIPEKNDDQVMLHKAAFEVIIRNILSNALKHSKATSIQFEYVMQEKQLLLKIIDNGIGLGQSQIDRLTFKNNMEQHSESYQSGFGLWLINFYSRLAHVDIYYEKTEKSNIFVFTFPIFRA